MRLFLLLFLLLSFSCIKARVSAPHRYYTDQNLKTLKGRIGCAGYKVEKDDKVKNLGLILKPYDEGRRTWYIACDSEEERQSWYSIFDNACSYAKPARDPDPMIQGAFEIAFEKLKRSVAEGGGCC